MGQPVGEVAVVREQQDAARVDVEPTHGHHPRLVTDDVDHRRAPFGVARRRHDTERLVEEDVGELLLAHPFAVDLDDVPRRDERVQLARLPVHRHPAGFDQLVCRPTRGDTGTGEVTIQAHAGIVASLPRGA